MDYTSSNGFATDAGTGNRMHTQNQAIPTMVTDTDLNGLIWSLMEIQKAGGIAAVAFDKAVPATYTGVIKAIKRMCGGNVRLITGAGPTVLTADDAGLVLLDATANAVAVTLPAANAVSTSPLLFEFVRVDGVLANAATVSRAGADTFVGGATSFVLSAQNDFRSVMSDSASKWATTSQTSTNGRQAGEVCLFARNTAPTGFLKCNGAAVSRSTYAALFAAIYKMATVTMTIAAPGVISWPGHTLSANDPVQFTSTGVLPTGFVTATNYYVVGASIVAGVSFQLSATPGGAAITTTGAQSGIHTAHNAPFGIGDGSTTFNVPELRGEFLRGWDDGRGVDASRAFGSAQLDAMQGHVHGGGYSGFNDRSGGAGGTPNLRSDGVSPNTTTPITDGSNGTPRTATETRGRNVPLLACIKF